MGPKKILGQKKFRVRQKIVPEKIWARKKFGSEKILGQKKFWVQQKFVPEKNVGPKKFGPTNFVVVVLLLVTWTPNPLNSAKSP